MRGAEAEEIKKEWNIARGQMIGVGIAALSLLSTGATFFHFFEKLTWINAFYFCTVTLTTVGYGDIVPTTNGEKLFIIFYVLVGIGIVATFANLIIKSTNLRREYNRALKREKKNDRAKS